MFLTGTILELIDGTLLKKDLLFLILWDLLKLNKIGTLYKIMNGPKKWNGLKMVMVLDMVLLLLKKVNLYKVYLKVRLGMLVLI